MENKTPSKMQTIIIGSAIGAVLGAVAGILLYQRAEKEQKQPQLSGSDGVKIGLGVLGIFRLITEIASRK